MPEIRKITARQLPVVPQTYDAENKSVHVIATTEDRVTVWDWDRGIIEEILSIDGLILPESGQVPVLDSHNRGSINDILGVAKDFQKKPPALEADVYFDPSAEGQKAAMKVQAGSLTDFSVGYIVTDSVWINENETQAINGKEYQGPVRVVRKWDLLELSATPIGADPKAKARDKKEVNNIERGNQIMTPEEIKAKEKEVEERKKADEVEAKRAAAEAEAQRKKADEEAQRKAAEAVHVERQRVIDITAICEKSGYPEKAGEYIEKGSNVETVRAAMFELMAEEKRAISSRLTVGVDEADKFRSAAIDGLFLRTGMNLDKPAAGFEEFRSKRLLRLAEECLVRQGINTRRMSDADIAKRAVFAQGTSDFPYILANVANKTLRTAYELTPTTYQAWTKIVPASDFKTMYRNQFSEAPELELINEHGEYTEAKFLESRESYRIYKYGKMFSLTWESIVNDDLGAFTRIPMAFGAAAARKCNSIVYGVLATNAVMSDSVALFYSTHGNLASGGDLGAPSVATLNAGRLAMRCQTGLNGATLNIVPRYLICGATYEGTVAMLLNSMGYPAATYSEGIYNPVRGMNLIPVIDATIEALSDSSWYLAADPNQIDTIEVAFLDDQRVPTLEEEEGFVVDGRRYKVRICVGAKAIDWRGLYKNPIS